MTSTFAGHSLNAAEFARHYNDKARAYYDRKLSKTNFIITHAALVHLAGNAQSTGLRLGRQSVGSTGAAVGHNRTVLAFPSALELFSDGILERHVFRADIDKHL